MKIDYKQYQSLLPPEKIDFLSKLMPHARNLQAQVISKCLDRKVPLRTEHGIRASIIMALAIIASDWGEYPVSQPRVHCIVEGRKREWEHGNNLWLVQSDESWRRVRSSIEFEGVIYKSYKNWEDAVSDLSDTFAYRYEYRKTLRAPDLYTQCTLVSIRGKHPFQMRKRLLDLISNYRLNRFDLNLRGEF